MHLSSFGPPHFFVENELRALLEASAVIIAPVTLFAIKAEGQGDAGGQTVAVVD
jgi:hypothetical protein